MFASSHISPSKGDHVIHPRSPLQAEATVWVLNQAVDHVGVVGVACAFISFLAHTDP